MAWGDGCHAWPLVAADGLSVKSERLPPDSSERPHLHEHAHQFFFVLRGRAVMTVAGRDIQLERHQGIEVTPGLVHQLRARGPEPLDVLVISSPSTDRDRHSP